MPNKKNKCVLGNASENLCLSKCIQLYFYQGKMPFKMHKIIFFPENLKSHCGVGDKPMSCKPGVAGSIPGFSQSVG